MKFIIFALLVTLACVSAVPAEGSDDKKCEVPAELKSALHELSNAQDFCGTLIASIKVVKGLVKSAEDGIIKESLLQPLKDLMKSLEGLTKSLEPICENTLLKNILTDPKLSILGDVKDLVQNLLKQLNGGELVEGTGKTACELLESLSNSLLKLDLKNLDKTLLDTLGQLPIVGELLKNLLSQGA